MDENACREYGIDLKTGAARFRGNTATYKKILTAFLRDSTFSRLRAANIRRDISGLLALAHEMKGVSGNAALTDLYGADCELLSYLRDGGLDTNIISGMFANVERAYERASEGIRLLVNS